MRVSPRSSASSIRIRSSKSRRLVFARLERRSTGILAASTSSISSPTIRLRCVRIRRTASGWSAAAPIRPPGLIRRNSGPALRLATACQAWKALTGPVSGVCHASRSPSPPRSHRSCCARAPGRHAEVLDPQPDQLAPQHPDEADQKEGAVAPAAASRRRIVVGAWVVARLTR